MKHMFTVMSGFAGMVLTYFYGSMSEPLSFLLFMMCMDYFSGVSASIKEGKGLSSRIGFWGITQKAFILLMIALAHRADLLLDTHMLMAGVIYFYMANELISITENYGRIGLPLPEQIRRLIALLQDKEKKSGD